MKAMYYCIRSVTFLTGKLLLWLSGQGGNVGHVDVTWLTQH